MVKMLHLPLGDHGFDSVQTCHICTSYLSVFQGRLKAFLCGRSSFMWLSPHLWKWQLSLRRHSDICHFQMLKSFFSLLTYSYLLVIQTLSSQNIYFLLVKG